MTQKDFWTALEFRICRELAGIPDDSIRSWWCDGLVPDSPPRNHEIHGDIWMCKGPHQFMWRFKLILPKNFNPTSQDWTPLLPAQDMTGWLSMDQINKRITINPTHLRPDNPEPQ